MMIRPTHRLLGLFAGLLLSGQVLAAAAAATTEPAQEGFDYKRLTTPLTVETGQKIEIAEFFWYRCPHCYKLEPALSAWAKKLPADAKLRPIPAVFSEQWLPAAKLFYTLQEMGVQEKLHGKVFDATHQERLDLNDEAVLLNWIKKQGLDETKFKSIYNSFTIQSSAMKGAQAARTAGIDGVPALIVDGKYLTSVSMTVTEKRLFEVLDQLIQRARKERGGKAASKKSAKKTTTASVTKPIVKPIVNPQ